MSERRWKRPREVVIRMSPLSGPVWDVEVEIDGVEVGTGTGPEPTGAFDVAGEILFGSTNDWLNEDYGPLREANH